MKSTMMTVALTALTKSPLNVRETKADDPAIAELAASILSKGLIQPLAVHAIEGKGKKYGVLAGQRRWKAIQHLKKEGAAFDFAAIPVNVVDGTEGELTEISLAENYVRQAMRPPEVYAAFRAIRDRNPDFTDAELAEHFGLEPSRIARIMRLAYLHPKVFDAYAGGELRDEQAFAYAATTDQDLQLQTYQAMAQRPDWQRHPADIRRAMKIGDDQHRKLLTFVGIEAYEAAGGRYEADLFADRANSGKVIDEEILLKLVNDKVADLRETLIAQHAGRGELVFADAAPTDKYGSSYHLRVHAVPQPPTEDQAARLAAIESREAELEADLDANPDWFGEDGEPTEAATERVKAIDAENERLRAEEDAIRAAIPRQWPEGDKIAVVQIGYDGQPSIELFWPGKAPKGSAGGGSSAPASKSAGETQRIAWGLNKDPMQAMLLFRRDMIRDQLVRTADSQIGLKFLIYSQARTILAEPDKDRLYTPRGEAQGIATPACQDEGSGSPPSSITKLYAPLTAGTEYRETRNVLAGKAWMTAKDPIQGFAEFLSAPPEDFNDAAAIVAGHGLLASTSFYGDGRCPRMIEELANNLESTPGAADWADTATFDAAFFELITHKARLALLDSWGLGERAKTLKKGESAEYCARVIRAARGDDEEAARIGISQEDRGEIALWRPGWLDTHTVAPLAAGAA